MELIDFLKSKLMSKHEFSKVADISIHTVYRILRDPNCKIQANVAKKILDATEKQVDYTNRVAY